MWAVHTECGDELDAQGAKSKSVEECAHEFKGNKRNIHGSKLWSDYTLTFKGN